MGKLQNEREEEMLIGGRIRAQQIQERQGLAYLPSGRRLIQDAVGTLETWLDDRRRWIEEERFSPYLHRHDLEIHDATAPLPSAVLAFVVVHTLMGMLMRGTTTVTTVADVVGKAVEDEIAFRAAKTEEPLVWRETELRWKRVGRKKRRTETNRAFRRKEIKLMRFGFETRIRVGNWLVQAAQTHTGVFRLKSSKATGAAMLTLTEEASDWLDRTRDLWVDYRPRFLSCYEPPLPWSDQYDGGFHGDALARSVLVAGDRHVVGMYETQPFGQSLAAVNYLQDTAYEIEPFTLGVLAHAIDNNRVWGGMVSPLPRPRPPVTGEKGSEEWTKSKKAAALVWWQNDTERAKRWSQAYMRRQAESDSGRPLYFVHQLDSRGRMYPLGEYLQPQGEDISRGMLRFHTGVPVETDEALRWLKIAGANAAGHDKLPFDARVAWVDDNRRLVEAVAEDPLSVAEWRDFDRPWSFLTWAKDYVGVLQGKPTYYPCGQDGTCNGLQLWSLLLRDEHLGRHVNVVPSDSPQDVYSVVNTAFQRSIEEWPADRDTTAHGYWLRLIRHYGGRLPREWAKRPTMTKPYSVTRYTIEQHFADLLFARFPHGHPERSLFIFPGVRKLLTWGARRLWDAMGGTLRGAHEGMEWIRACSDVIVQAGASPHWISPSGLYVHSGTRKLEKVAIKLVFGAKTWRRHARRPIDAIDSRRTRNAISPNYIHSLDAALAHLLALRMKAEGIPALRSVHDSFAVHAPYVPAMNTAIRELLIEMFTPDRLALLRDYWQAEYRVELPELPAYGNLDVHVLRDSQYAFC